MKRLNVPAIKKAIRNGMPAKEVLDNVKVSCNFEFVNHGTEVDKLINDIFEDIYKNNPIEVKPLGLPLNTLFKKLTIMEAKNG